MAVQEPFLRPILRDPSVTWCIENQRTGEILAGRVEPAFESEARRKGLLGRDRLPAGHALIIAPSNAIHTCFMRFPIDVLFVARNGTVLKVRRGVAPWRAAAAWRGYAVIEMAGGSVRPGAAERGDRLRLVRCAAAAGQ